MWDETKLQKDEKNQRNKENKTNINSNANMPFYILSCDGGGVRTLSTIYFLLAFEEYMKSVNPNFKIYEFFDMYAGTSAGGVLIGLIVYAKKEISELVKIYNIKTITPIFKKSLLDKIFGQFQKKPMYDGVYKKKIISDIIGSATFGQTDKHVVIPVYDIEHKSKIFYSGCPDTSRLSVTDILDATSAAPSYFPSVNIDGKWYMDGGLIANNPTMCAITVAKKIMDTANQREIIIINVGTGSKIKKISGANASTYGGIQWIFNDIFNIPLDDSLVEIQSKLIVNPCNYIRINGDLGDINSNLDNTDKMNMIKLCDLGRGWWKTNCDNIIKLVKKHPLIFDAMYNIPSVQML